LVVWTFPQIQSEGHTSERLVNGQEHHPYRRAQVPSQGAAPALP